MRERGSALLTAVVSVMVLLLISGILFSYVKNQFKLQTNEEKALRAYYLAESGASYGVAYIYHSLKNGASVDEIRTLKGDDLNKLNQNGDNPFGSDYGGTFEVEELLVGDPYTIDRNDPTLDPTVKVNTVTVYIITATCNGYYPSKADKNHIKRSIKKDYAFTLPTEEFVKKPDEIIDNTL